ncbi:unnamed protein product [Urochloa humidicola]
MNSSSEGEWSASEIMVMKSVIAGRNTTTNNNIDVVEELHARFPGKEKRQVTDLYVNLLVEMIESSNQHVAARTSHMIDNIAMSVEDSAMDNLDMLRGCLMEEETGAMGPAEEAPWSKSAPQKERPHNKGFWSMEEHRQFLLGLLVYGRGKWKSISQDFVKTRTPVQISSHAQKYFSKQQNTSSRQRYGINDIGLNHTQPLAPNNASGTGMHGGLTFSGGTFIPDDYTSASQLASMNNLTHVQSPLLYRASQASTGSIQEDAFAGSQHQLIGNSRTSAVPVMQDVGCQMPWTGDQLEDFLADEWIFNMDMN